ncbi:MAG: 2-oxoacid:acceptor oxidoreductase family protein [Gammaproteobacteria bacterium]|nr:2-oxoacid:acceptor oxidoreductase family protein [Gammaproteobacteria bacterium]MCP5425057.1 2-oxoacid:acceptor oxidoreductase family protein [Gammaproteobacteria bacterium]MCP5459760.1 2-oxoacid:acceptor oxidoreductase family protein [Gammaproteobacteria bacterium]
MFQIRIHGRGGQGVVSASEMMSVAAFHNGRYSMSFPSFGSERMGAPVMAFVRIDDKEIELREPVLDPDLLIIQDPTLFHAIDVFSGLKDTGYVLINSRKTAEELGILDAVKHLPAGHVVSVPATDLALKHIKRPTPNTVLLGAATAMHSDLFEMASVEKAIMEIFPGKVGEMNVNAAKAAHDVIAASRQAH